MNKTSGGKEAQAVGSTEMKFERKKALRKLQKAKEVEADRIKKGWVWLSLGKESRLVHPNNVTNYLAMGYKKVRI